MIRRFARGTQPRPPPPGRAPERAEEAGRAPEEAGRAPESARPPPEEAGGPQGKAELPAAEPELSERPLDPPGEPAIIIADSPQITPFPQTLSQVGTATVCVVAGLTFGLLTAWVVHRGTAVPAVDEHIHRWVLAHRGAASTAIARAIRWGGVSWIVLPALIPVGAATAGARSDLNRRLGSGLLLCLIASTGVYAETRINGAVGRLRPPVSDWAGSAAGPSFPSGHTTNATLFALCCAWALAARVPPGWSRRAVWAGAAAYAAAIGWSRVWLGVHWPTDVVGGWLFDTAWFAGCVTVIIIVRRRFATAAEQRAQDAEAAGPQDAEAAGPQRAEAAGAQKAEAAGSQQKPD